MGRSKSSCFNVISCNCGGPVDGDEVTPEEESKASSNKRRWSFPKRSSGPRVLSKIVTSEPGSVSKSKENLEVFANTFGASKNSFVAEKEHAQERPRVTFSLPSAIEDTEEAYPAVAIKSTPSLQESDAIVIQCYIRGLLARKELKYRKSIVKLQAALRGRLVRRQAVGTLRCVQAIVKMQALVRARHARQVVEKLSATEDKDQIGIERSIQLKGLSLRQPNKTFSSTEKLLSNTFARQLLESTSKTKAINIKCDPSKFDSAWKWLERWMAVTSSDVGQQQEQLLHQQNQEVKENTKFAQNEEANELKYATISVSSDIISAAISMQNFKAKDAGDFEFNVPSVHDDGFNSLSKDNVQFPQLQNEVLDATQDKITKTENIGESVLNSLPSPLQFRQDPIFEKVDQRECIHIKHNTESEPSEILEAEGKNYLQGSRRSCSPAFAAVQSKFEELSSKSSVGRSNISSYQDAAAAKSRQESQNTLLDSLTKSKETCSTETSVFQDPRVQVAASECGTEISISSTLDSPDTSETEGEEIVLEIGALERENNNINADSSIKLGIRDMENEEKKYDLHWDVPRPKVHEDDDSNLVDSITLVESMQANGHPVEATISDKQSDMKSVSDKKVKSSTEESPRSHATAPSLQSTPSSQISTKAKKTKKNSNVAKQKQKFLLAVKMSPTNSGNDSGGRSNMEHIPKDKIGKRRNSFGMANVDQEPRISSCSSLPSYMQATVSARAKSHSNVSPKMSPDMHDNQIKKRHSLPIDDGKQNSSPRMNRSASQAQQNSKTNITHSPQSSAERRWQR